MLGGAVGPVAVDDVAVVEQVLGLDTRDHTQFRETLHIGVIEQLRVLDAAARAVRANACNASAFAASPIACTAQSKPASVARRMSAR